MSIITVFTPTYNRAYILPQLYKSLTRQTEKDFEWLIVDDGSTDNTRDLIVKWQKEGLVDIRYYCQKNGGKHRAYNRGVKEAKGELFYTVDSDDYLPDNALERVMYHYSFIKNKKEFSGICGCRYYHNNTRIGGDLDFDVIECSQFYLRYQMKVKGDMAGVVKTEVLRQYPFPEIEGENFCAESMIFDQMADKYLIRFFNENIYYCEYLPDGLTAKMTRIRMDSPRTTTLYYSVLYNLHIPLLQKIKASINYWRFRQCIEGECFYSLPWYCVFLYPFGYALHVIDKKLTA